MSERSVGAAEFKAKCLQLMDDVERTRQPVIVTKRGRAVVRIVPATEEQPRIFGALKGMMTIHGDIVEPIGDPWEADS